MVAVGAAETLLSQGHHIPEDISIVGFGNILLSHHFRVPLTTVRQPKFHLGEAAVDLLLQLMKGQNPEPRRMPAELVIRASTGPAKVGK
jgi:DNA-binding LacI/PurR family transcriptional regulator